MLATLLLCGCGEMTGGHTLPLTDAEPRAEAVEPITSTERSYIEVTDDTTAASTEAPEVVVTGTSSPIVTTKPPVTEAPKETYTVKFVDSDGYTAVSLQTVVEGESAVAPAMPEKRGELYFRGWDRDFSKVQRSMIITAIYAKELYTVRFFDFDGTLLKTEVVHYGEDAEAPEVADRDGYLFNGWSVLFDNVHADMDIYAVYYTLPQRDRLSLISAYGYLPHTDNLRAWEDEVYYRRIHDAVVTVGEEEYAGSCVLYGNFCDSFVIEGYDFEGIEGQLVLTGMADPLAHHIYGLTLTLIGDGKTLYSTTLREIGASASFDVRLNGIKELTIVLEPTLDGYVYYDEAVFVGGLVDVALYKEI